MLTQLGRTPRYLVLLPILGLAITSAVLFANRKRQERKRQEREGR